MYTDNEDQINYAEKMKTDLINIQNIKIKLFKSLALSNQSINSIVPHIIGKYEGNITFTPVTQHGFDIEIVLNIADNLTEDAISYMVDDFMFNFYVQLNTAYKDVLTNEEWALIFNNNFKNMLHTTNRFPGMIIIRF